MYKDRCSKIYLLNALTPRNLNLYTYNIHLFERVLGYQLLYFLFSFTKYNPKSIFAYFELSARSLETLF